MEIKKVTDSAFRPYGKILEGYDVTKILAEMKHTPLPTDVTYVPSVENLEVLDIFGELGNSGYGGMPIQVGYCNGHNNKLNALEYHRDSEVNIAATDLILLLGQQKDIEEDYTYDTAKVEAFFVPEGTAIEVYATTLHYAPCGVDGNGFRCVIVLPRKTNTDIDFELSGNGEDKLLFARNKWLIA
ncbi:DUF4867 family protein, partial [Lachnospiraceae bacterium OttesenSCG-928-E19]|nr:DUF4867 family protein [Lachnospiraceae bacterium OttesenSCG-928-E19]